MLRSCPDIEKSQRKKEACEARACRVLSWLWRNKGLRGAAPRGLCSQSLQLSRCPCKLSFLPRRGMERGVRVHPPTLPTGPCAIPSASPHGVPHTCAHTDTLQAPRVHGHTLGAAGPPTSARPPKAMGGPSSAAHLRAEKRQKPPRGESAPSPSGTGTAAAMPMGTGAAPGPGLGEQRSPLARPGGCPRSPERFQWEPECEEGAQKGLSWRRRAPAQ